jgi:hypothetical protein
VPLPFVEVSNLALDFLQKDGQWLGCFVLDLAPCRARNSFRPLNNRSHLLDCLRRYFGRAKLVQVVGEALEARHEIAFGLSDRLRRRPDGKYYRAYRNYCARASVTKDPSFHQP